MQSERLAIIRSLVCAELMIYASLGGYGLTRRQMKDVERYRNRFKDGREDMDEGDKELR